MLSFQPGNLPAVGTGAQAPDHEELVVPQSTCLKYGVFCVAILHAKDLVFYGVNFRVPCCSLPYCLPTLNKERKQEHMRRITYKKAAAVAMAAALSAALLVGCGPTQGQPPVSTPMMRSGGSAEWLTRNLASSAV